MVNCSYKRSIHIAEECMVAHSTEKKKASLGGNSGRHQSTNGLAGYRGTEHDARKF